ncbi:hypothetical protein [Enterovirga rhinocerotis]|uniref:Lipoprotein n=1 Tax=Enterovirga rhinocerotis TaxID=1339210 RepID=A0A4R7BSS0_9HYPH|nr:hypothetical protein [Enterovirga rhinocerotis]TDR87137.1 hypothetical protein EV668_4217 [Enterovirga rhinocerotis]
MRNVAMMPSPSSRRSALLAVLLAGTMALSVGACGRRGRPEPPPDPSQPVQTQPKSAAKADASKADASKAAMASRAGAGSQAADDDDEEESPTSLVSPQPMPSSRKKAPAYQVPKQPFILDGLL